NKAKVEEIIQKFTKEKVDLVFTLGTSATLPVFREMPTTPVIFSIVYDPIAAGIAKSWKSSGNNTTGTSSYVPMKKILDTIAHFPNLHKMAVLYTPGELSSEFELKNLTSAGKDKNNKIKIVPVPITTNEELDLLLPEVIRNFDAIYITASNLIDGHIDTIIPLTIKSKIVTVTFLEDMLNKGVLIGLGQDYYKLGVMCAQKALKIFKGVKPSDIPIDFHKTNDVVLNVKTAKEGQFQIPDALMKKVTKKIE
ncbi:MAG: ABC transporter substrate-binding protein, partial [Pseudomonadota bacterium]